MTKIWTFITKSSADPKATSASIKFALLAVIPYIMQALSIACDFGQQCYDVDPSLLETGFDAIANGIFYSLSLVSVVGTIHGLVRKFIRTATGNNLALQDNK